MHDIEKQIQVLLDSKQLQKKIILHIDLVQAKIEDRKSEKESILDSLQASLDALTELDSLTAKSLFEKTLGNHEEQYHRTRQEYLIGFLKLRTCEERIAAKEYEVLVLQRKLASMASVNELLTKLVHQKKQYLKIKNKDVASKIVGLESSIRIYGAEIKEINEAVGSGLAAISALDHLLSGLSTITSWEPEARVLSSNTPLSYKQKSFSRDLLVEIRAANKSLDDFLDELQDVSVQYDLDYKRYLDRLGNFVDNLFDGLISDWIFYQQIKTSKANVEETKDQVKRIIGMLRLDSIQVEQNKEEVQKSLDDLIISVKK